MLSEILEATERPAAEPENPKTEAPATGRLSTAQYIVTLSQLEAQLKLAVDAFRKLPECPPQQVENALRAILDASRGAAMKAEKLLSANR